MAKRLLNRLSARAVTTAPPGEHLDGNGLLLIVAESGSRSWVLRFKLNGRRRDMGLGPASVVGLAKARDLAHEARRLIAQGIDPIEHRKAEQAAAKIEAAKAISFEEFATTFMNGREAGLANIKHRQQWRNTLATYAFPIIGHVAVGAVDTPMLLRILQPIWSKKPETASRVRGRIETILDAARVQGLRDDGVNPAIWRGHLSHVLPPPSKVRAVTHHAALDWRELPAFVANLRERDGVAARALLFAILCASRSGEVRLARWREIDMANKVWTIPADRMKAKRVHRVPLSAPAIALLEGMLVISPAPEPRTKLSDDALIFPGAAKGKPMSDMTLTAVLRRMERGELTAHGFRSTFKDWCRERAGSFSDVLSEMALAHVVGDKTMQAYGRSDLLEQRRALMDAWASYVTSADRADNVIALHPPGA
jgi:integrase